MQWINYSLESLLLEWLGALIPTTLIWFGLRKFLFKSGRLAPVFSVGISWIIGGFLRSLGSADGGPINWIDGFTFMLIPALAVLAIDYFGTGAGEVDQPISRKKD